MNTNKIHMVNKTNKYNVMQCFTQFGDPFGLVAQIAQFYRVDQIFIYIFYIKIYR